MKMVLSDTAEFAYKCDNFYSKAHEGGVRFDDPVLGIDWEFDLGQVFAFLNSFFCRSIVKYLDTDVLSDWTTKFT